MTANLPTRCPSWCDRHIGGVHRSQIATIPLTLHQIGGPDATSAVAVVLGQTPDGTPLVFVDSSGFVALTPGEAALLSEALAVAAERSAAEANGGAK